MDRDMTAVGQSNVGFLGVEELMFHLDSDRARALERYEDIERKLMEFFECNGCSPASHFVRRTLAAMVGGLSAYTSATTAVQISEMIFEHASYLVKEARGFQALLDHLSQDRNSAAEQYEKLRWELIRFFRHNDCSVPEDLADKTFDRVAKKLGTQKIDSIAAYVMGFAKNIVREDRSLPAVVEIKDWDFLPQMRTTTQIQSERECKESQLACLEECIQELTPVRRELFLEYFLFAQYYKGEEQARHRQRLAQRLSLTANALQARAHRLREMVERCVRARIRKAVETARISIRTEKS